MTNPRLTVTGSGSVGHIADWSVTEEATPVSIADTSGGVGSLSLSAASTSSSIYLNDCLASFSHGTRTFAGRVMSAQIQGAKADVTVESSLRILNAVRTAPPAGSFLTPEAVVANLSTYGGIAWDASGNLFVCDITGLRVRKYTESSPGVWGQVAATAFTTAGSSDGQFGASGPYGVACDASGNVYVTDPTNNRVQKFTNGLVYSAKQGSAGSGNTQYSGPAGIAYDSAAGNLVVMDPGNTRTKRINTSLVYVSQVNTGIAYARIAVDSAGNQAWCGNTIGSAEVVYVASGGAATTAVRDSSGVAFDPLGKVWSSYASTLSRLTPPALAGEDMYTSYGAGLGNAISFWQIAINASGRLAASDPDGGTIQVFANAGVRADATVPLSEAFATYVALADEAGDITVTYAADDDPDVAFPGWTDSVWTKLKQLCAAYRLEMRFVNGTLTIDDVASRTLTVDNRSVPTVTPASIQPARGINVVNQNVTAGNGLVMYDAAEAGTIHTVAAGATTHVVIATTNHPLTVNNPQYVGSGDVGDGEYKVQDSTGTTVPTNDWDSTGGFVTASIGATPGAIDITIHGPRSEIAGYPGPYTLSTGTDADRVGALSITGSGVTTSPTVHYIPTGADPERVTSDTVRTVDIPFIDTLERAIDAGVQAAASQLFTQTVTFRIPHSSSNSFGDIVGRRFRYGDAYYRITRAVHTAGGIDITAAWHTTVGDLDTLWSGSTVGTFDTLWSARPVRDNNATPLKTS